MSDSLIDRALSWYGRNARDLPWRRADTTPWAILVSEVMLQQTPVSRVIPAYLHWLERWSTPASLAADPPSEAVRAWGKLGYPRRALRLHETASVLASQYGGEVPADIDVLLSLPGIGSYTARAVVAFAFGKRQPVVDTNVRRFVARAIHGHGDAGPVSTRRDLAAVEALLPSHEATAAQFSAALMELGALVCTARAPACVHCPVQTSCAWRLAGHPPYAGPTRTPQRFAGTDRQVRGLLMDVLRGCEEPVTRTQLDATWLDDEQRTRALASLVADGLVESLPDGRYALPTTQARGIG